MMQRLAFVLALGAACGPSSKTVVTSQEPFVGHWYRDLPNGERYLLHLFASGIVGFQHVGAKLPISASYGRWTAAGDVLRFTIVVDEPEQPSFPLAEQLTASIDRGAQSLTLVSNGDSSVWFAHDTYGASRAGWQERAARHERGLTSLVEDREKRAGAAP